MRPKYLPQDNEARINNGIVRYEGIPYVLSLLSNTKALLSPLSSQLSNKEVRLDDQKLDISSPPLGYMNTPEGALYVSRIPMRRYKQTLQAQTCEGRWAYALEANVPDRCSMDYLNTTMVRKPGHDMITNSYPSLMDVIETHTRSPKKPGFIAISRTVAIGSSQYGWAVHLKGERIGTIDPSTKKITLVESDYSWITKKVLGSLNLEFSN